MPTSYPLGPSQRSPGSGLPDLGINILVPIPGCNLLPPPVVHCPNMGLAAPMC